MYNTLIDMGYTQNEIDEMDLVQHMKLMSRRKAEKEEIEEIREPIYFDQVLEGIGI